MFTSEGAWRAGAPRRKGGQVGSLNGEHSGRGWDGTHAEPGEDEMESYAELGEAEMEPHAGPEGAEMDPYTTSWESDIGPHAEPGCWDILERKRGGGIE